MTAVQPDPPIQRLAGEAPHDQHAPGPGEEDPGFDPSKLRHVSRRDLGYRFVAGALTSIVAGSTTLAFGPRVGGVLLAFPAILVACLTLIAHEEDREEAREDAHGAILGAVALIVFAAIAGLGFGHLSAALVLALATIAWLVVAILGYAVLWRR